MSYYGYFKNSYNFLEYVRSLNEYSGKNKIIFYLGYFPSYVLFSNNKFLNSSKASNENSDNVFVLIDDKIHEDTFSYEKGFKKLHKFIFYKENILILKLKIITHIDYYLYLVTSRLLLCKYELKDIKLQIGDINKLKSGHIRFKLILEESILIHYNDIEKTLYNLHPIPIRIKLHSEKNKYTIDLNRLDSIESILTSIEQELNNISNNQLDNMFFGIKECEYIGFIPYNLYVKNSDEIHGNQIIQNLIDILLINIIGKILGILNQSNENNNEYYLNFTVIFLSFISAIYMLVLTLIKLPKIVIINISKDNIEEIKLCSDRDALIRSMAKIILIGNNKINELIHRVNNKHNLMIITYSDLFSSMSYELSFYISSSLLSYSVRFKVTTNEVELQNDNNSYPIFFSNPNSDERQFITIMNNCYIILTKFRIYIIRNKKDKKYVLQLTRKIDGSLIDYEELRRNSKDLGIRVSYIPNYAVDELLPSIYKSQDILVIIVSREPKHIEIEITILESIRIKEFRLITENKSMRDKKTKLITILIKESEISELRELASKFSDESRISIIKTDYYSLQLSNKTSLSPNLSGLRFVSTKKSKEPNKKYIKSEKCISVDENMHQIKPKKECPFIFLYSINKRVESFFIANHNNMKLLIYDWNNILNIIDEIKRAKCNNNISQYVNYYENTSLELIYIWIEFSDDTNFDISRSNYSLSELLPSNFFKRKILDKKQAEIGLKNKDLYEFVNLLILLTHDRNKFEKLKQKLD